MVSRLVSLVVLLAVGCFVAARPSRKSDWVRVPGGVMLHRSCVHIVPNGFVVSEATSKPCKYKARYPNEQIYAIDVHYQGTDLMANMNASWNAPPVPSADQGQVVYFWPGFKSSQPEMGWPVLQPVLQYGQDSQGGGPYWCVRSWFVWGQQGQAFASPEVPVSEADVISSYMEYNQASSNWTVYAKNTNTNQNTTLQISHDQVGQSDFQFAMLVLETIMPPNQCNLLPAQPGKLTFDHIKVNGNTSPAWTQRVQMHDCNQALSVTSSSVTMTWGN